jgi:hypothetical protein
MGKNEKGTIRKRAGFLLAAPEAVANSFSTLLTQ